MLKFERVNRDKIFPKIILLSILLILTVTASYTWFSLSTTPRVSGLDIYINSPVGLELSTEATGEEWVRQLAFNDMATDTSPLRPCTWSEDKSQFFAASYGSDGRLLNNWFPIEERIDYNGKSATKYYTKGICYARTGERITVSLSEAVEVEEGVSGAGTYVVGTPKWNSEKLRHDNGGAGAEFAIRVGFRITFLDKSGEELDIPNRFIIYEPNAFDHEDGSEGYSETPSIDGADSLVPIDRIITQSSSTWEETYPVEHGVVVYEMGKFSSDTELFTLEKDQIAKIEIYIWLEGQDKDCTNKIGHEADIFANIQFAGDIQSQGGLVPIE